MALASQQARLTQRIDRLCPDTKSCDPRTKAALQKLKTDLVNEKTKFIDDLKTSAKSSLFAGKKTVTKNRKEFTNRLDTIISSLLSQQASPSSPLQIMKKDQRQRLERLNRRTLKTPTFLFENIRV